MAHTLRLLQFADSVFPVGGFAFSNGLEAAVHHRVVRDRPTLAEYVRTVTRLAATGDGVALLAGYRGAAAGDLARVRRADEAVMRHKLNEEARTMTVRMGRKLAEAASHIIGEALLDRRFRAAAEDGAPVTYPVTLGAVFAVLGLSEQEAFLAHQYNTAATVLSAALRLMRVGHLDAQAILFEVNTHAVADYHEVATADLTDMHAFAPTVDVLAAAHLHAHVRMFMN